MADNGPTAVRKMLCSLQPPAFFKACRMCNDFNRHRTATALKNNADPYMLHKAYTPTQVIGSPVY